MRKFIIAAFVALLSVSAFGQTAEQLWGDLMAGNQLFVKGGQVVYDSLRETRREGTTSQRPPVSILSCSDSRVPPEVVFQKTLGELFVVRVAGNVDDEFGIASLEYAAIAPREWTKLIVVLGHSNCGAVQASLEAPRPPPPFLPTPSLYALIIRIRKSFTVEKPELRAATVMNVNYTAQQLANNDSLKRVPIIKAYYDIATGKVERLR
ncbi:MAG TPA: carbonic anhydrase [Thermoanaerobaculia bacterium]|nr:carbonic anhydrase [Thermoanaerobaculia bacterium]